MRVLLRDPYVGRTLVLPLGRRPRTKKGPASPATTTPALTRTHHVGTGASFLLRPIQRPRSLSRHNRAPVETRELASPATTTPTPGRHEEGPTLRASSPCKPDVIQPLFFK